MSDVDMAQTAPESRNFLLPHDCGRACLISLLGGDERCREEGTEGFTLRFYDSFDWRLYAAGLRLLRVEAGGQALLRLRPAVGDEIIDSVEVESEPDWPAALPQGLLRDRVVACLDMRVLLPLAANPIPAQQPETAAGVPTSTNLPALLWM